MSKKKQAPHPTPPGNRTTFGPGTSPPDDDAAEAESQGSSGAGFNEQDPKRRLGGYETAGEHSIVQPGGKNAAQRRSGEV